MRSLVLVVLAAGCTTSIGADTPAACAAIEGKTYETPSALECGLGPNGPQTCIWHISFDSADTFHWQHSDIADETGHITCSGTTVTGGSYSGTWDTAAMTLTWQNQLYNLQH